MTEQETRAMRIMEKCVSDAEFCDECELGEAEYEVCAKAHKDFFATVKETIAQRDALLTDLNLACGGKFVDVCCICGHYTPENPGEKCELKGLDCRWEWRGLQHG